MIRGGPAARPGPLGTVLITRTGFKLGWAVTDVSQYPGP